LARVQAFMLARYLLRLGSFRWVPAPAPGPRALAEEAVARLAARPAGEVAGEVAGHLALLGKMKRRMKSMLDVSDKYSVGNMFAGLGVLAELGQELGEERGRLSRSTEEGSADSGILGSSHLSIGSSG
jgi:hypothetical protein